MEARLSLGLHPKANEIARLEPQQCVFDKELDELYCLQVIQHKQILCAFMNELKYMKQGDICSTVSLTHEYVVMIIF